MSGARVVTLTANPSLDRTLDLPVPLTEGGIVRLSGTSTEPGGKGVNVARAIAAAGGDVVSVLPAADSDPIVQALRALGLELATVPVETPVRTNYTLVDPAGTTTKLNEPGAPLTEHTRAALTGALHAHAATAQWVVLSGSLPPSTPAGWYAEPGWPKPGNKGASILVGHINHQGNPDVFWNLPSVKLGDIVTVTYGSGRQVKFKITRSEAAPKTGVPKDDTIWDWDNPEPVLRLITCDPDTPLSGGHYEGNWVVWADEMVS